MGEIVNLNRFRKATAKAEAVERADANRLLHGLTRAQKEAARKANAKAKTELDGKKKED